MEILRHTEKCLRYGISDDCPSCRFIESRESFQERERKYRERYRRLIPMRKLR